MMNLFTEICLKLTFTFFGVLVIYLIIWFLIQLWSISLS